jgi:hypothetical protein
MPNIIYLFLIALDIYWWADGMLARYEFKHRETYQDRLP